MPYGDTIGYEVVSSASFDLPVFDWALRGQRYRYAYGIGQGSEGPWWNTIYKADLDTKTTMSWSKPHHYPSEPTFIAAPGATSEDDGVVLSVVLDAYYDHSYLLVLNATTWEEIAMARAPIPFPSHGLWADASVLYS